MCRSGMRPLPLLLQLLAAAGLLFATAPMAGAATADGRPVAGAAARSAPGHAASGSPFASRRTSVAPSSAARVIPRLGRSAPSHATAPPAFLTALERALLAPPSAAAATPLSWGFLSSFAGPGDTGDVIPPDTMGAAGPSHLVALLNSEFAVFTKDGTELTDHTARLEGFWAPILSSLPLGARDPFDPRILYDAAAGRFVAVSLAGKLSPPSYVLLAVSDSSDPTGNWHYWAVDAEEDVLVGGGVSRSGLWADYPNLGVDNAYVYVTTNRFDTSDVFGDTKVWTIPKGQLTESSPPDTIVWYEFVDPAAGESRPPGVSAGQAFCLVPAVTYGTPGRQYFVDEGYDNNTALERYLHVGYVAGTGSGGAPEWHNAGFVRVPTYPKVDMAWSVPEARQLGSPRTIDAGDTRVQHVVSRGGLLYLVHGVPDDTRSRGEAAWYVVDPSLLPANSGTTLPLVQAGRIRHPSRSYYYPSLAVNGAGDVGFGFSGSSSASYVSSYAAARGAADAAGSTRAVLLLKAGGSPYAKTLGGSRVRWGDFSATCVDPFDAGVFWTLQEYAAPTDNTWGTWWGRFVVAPGAAPAGLSARTSRGAAVVSWTLDGTPAPTAFLLERRTVPAGDFATVATIDNALARSFTDNTVAAAMKYEYRLVALYPSGPSCSEELPFTLSTGGGGGGGGCSASGDGTGQGLLLPLATLLPALLAAALRRRRAGGGTGFDTFPGNSAAPR